MKSSETKTVGSGAYTIFGPYGLNGEDSERLGIGLNNGGASALAEFIVQIKDEPDDEFYTILSGTDFGTATEVMPFSSSAVLATLGNGLTAHFHLAIPQATEIQFKAKSAGTSSLTVSVQGARG